MTTFLYVEDDPVSRKIMQMILVQDMGYSDVFMFEDSSDFMQRMSALSSQPDIIFLDIHVEPLNGFEMLAKLRHITAIESVPIVAMTASVMNEELHALKEANFDGAIAKPIDIDSFPTLVGLILQGKAVWHIS